LGLLRAEAPEYVTVKDTQGARCGSREQKMGGTPDLPESEGDDIAEQGNGFSENGPHEYNLHIIGQ
jgi:hypothetical protein